MPLMYVQTHTYTETGGYQYDNLDSGWIVINGQVSKPVPYLWWVPHSQIPSEGYQWWESMYGSELPEVESYLAQLDFHYFEEDEYGDVFYLILPRLEGDPFAVLGQELLTYSYYDPSIDLQETFSSILADGNTIDRVIEEDWASYSRNDRDPDMLINFLKEQEMEQPCTTEISIQMASDCPRRPEPVPEYSSILTFVVFGIFIFGGLFRRRLK